jgi:hypothetical protein
MLNKQQTLEQQQLEAENIGKKVEDEAVEYSFNPAARRILLKLISAIG